MLKVAPRSLQVHEYRSEFPFSYVCIYLLWFIYRHSVAQAVFYKHLVCE